MRPYRGIFSGISCVVLLANRPTLSFPYLAMRQRAKGFSWQSADHVNHFRQILVAHTPEPCHAKMGLCQANGGRHYCLQCRREAIQIENGIQIWDVSQI